MIKKSIVLFFLIWLISISFLDAAILRGIILRENFISWQDRGQVINKIDGDETNIAINVLIGNTKKNQKILIKFYEGKKLLLEEVYITNGHKNDVFWFKPEIEKWKDKKYSVLVSTKDKKQEFIVPVDIKKRKKDDKIEKDNEIEIKKERKNKKAIKLKEIAKLIKEKNIKKAEEKLKSFEYKKDRRYYLMHLKIMMFYLKRFEFKKAEKKADYINEGNQFNEKFLNIFKEIKNRKNDKDKSTNKYIKNYYKAFKYIKTNNFKNLKIIFDKYPLLYEKLFDDFYSKIYNKENINDYKTVYNILKEKNKKEKYLKYIYSNINNNQKKEFEDFVRNKKIDISLNKKYFVFYIIVLSIVVIFVIYILIRLITKNYLEKGLKLYKQRDYKEAAEYIEKYINKNKGNIDKMVYKKLAQIYLELGDIKKAVKYFKKCDEIISSN